MKRLIYSLLFAIFSFSSIYGQTNIGDRLIGGNAFFGFSDNISLTISPNVAWFLKDKFAIGTYLDYNFSKSGSNKNHRFSLGPLTRYYFTNCSDLSFFSFGSIGYAFNQIKGDNFKETYNSFRFSTGLGVAYFITQQVALEAQAGYHVLNIASDLDIKHSIALTIGFQIHLLKDQ